jgi:hypothetical protein
MSATNFLERTLYDALFHQGSWPTGLAPANLELVLLHSLPDEDGSGANPATSPASGDDTTGFTPGYLRPNGAAGVTTPIEDTTSFLTALVGNETGVFTNDQELDFGGNWSGGNAPGGDSSDYGSSRVWLTIVGWAIKVKDSVADLDAADGYFTTNPTHRYLMYGEFYDSNGSVITYEPQPGNAFIIPANAFLIEID